MSMFDLRNARDAAGRMDLLSAFLAYWYGPRRPDYGETAERLDRVSLPYPLRRFYAFAGCWPPPDPDYMDFFYQGGSGHHLRDMDTLETLEAGRLDFFMEYQGDWSGLTLPQGDDPPVWLRGCWDGDDEEPDAGQEDEEGERVRQASDSLSSFLITHCLMTTLYEPGNSAAAADERDAPMVGYLEENRKRAIRLWDVGDLWWPPSCLNYKGAFYLLSDEGILVHETGTERRFVALRPAGANVIQSHRHR